MGPEKRFENKIKQWCKANGIWFYKTHGSGYTRSGVPDLILCADGRFIALEVKSANGKPSELQLREIGAIRTAGGMAEIVYPRDWPQLRKQLDNFITKKTTRR